MRRHFYPSLSQNIPDRRKRRTRQKVKKIVHFTFLFVSIPVFFACAVFLFFFSKFFAIERIDVVAQGDISPQDVRSVLFKKMDEQRFLFGRNGNIFLFDKESALDALETSFAVDTVFIQRVFPATIQVTISGKAFAGIWCTQGNCYALTMDGKISRQVDAASLGVDTSKFPESFYTSSTISLQRTKKIDAQPLSLPLFIDEKNNLPPQDQSPLISSLALGSIREMVGSLLEKKIPIVYIKTHYQSADTTAITEEGWSILFTPFEEIRPQVENLQTILDTKIKKNRKKLKYIDVRFQNHIYYTFW